MAADHDIVDVRVDEQVEAGTLRLLAISAPEPIAGVDAPTLKQAGLDVDNGILVDARLRTSDPSVFAIGDVANHDHPVLGRRIRVEHWDTAIEQAKVAAANLLGGEQDYERQPYFFTDQYDLGMEYWGHGSADDDVEVEGDLAGRVFRAFWVRDGVVVAAMQANDWDASGEVKATVGKPR